MPELPKTEMICFGEEKYKPALMEMWKLCFPEDTDEFVRFYFNKVYKDNETLILLHDGRPAASLQLIPYPLQTGFRISTATYISGAMTHPAFRRHGYMERLLNEAFAIMRERGSDYTFLIPQEDWLFGFYEKYGYQKAFPLHESTVLPANNNMQPGRIIMEHDIVRRFSSLNEVDLRKSYAAYYELLSMEDNVILKTREQFANILEDLFISGGSFFMNVWGVAFALPHEEQVIIKDFFYNDEETKSDFTAAFAQAYPGKELLLQTDPDKPFLRYKGMIKPLGGTSVPSDIYMSMMLD